MLGIGLGGLAKGFGKGYGIGKEIKADWEADKQKEGMKDAIASGQTEYDAAVTAGTDRPNDPNGILRYAMPKIANAYAKAGDVDGIKTVNEWVQSDQAKQGTSLFASGLLKGQNGDLLGAAKDFIAAAAIKGYGPGYEVSSPPAQAEDGSVSFALKDPKTGKTATKTFKDANEIATWGAGNVNPESVFEEWKGTLKAKSEDARDVAKAGETERAKLGAKTDDDVVRANLGVGGKGPNYIAAKNVAIRELNATGQLGNFSGAPSADQAALIEKKTQEIMQQSGSVGISTSTDDVEDDEEYVVDSKTGQIVKSGN